VANTQGGHFFGATLEEHNYNVMKYRRLLAGEPADPPRPRITKTISKKRIPGKKRKGAAR
jgi:hypothetical protein